MRSARSFARRCATRARAGLARAGLAGAGLAGAVEPTVWQRPWTVHIQPIGSGEHATRYLARYVYHVALPNHRLERFAHDHVTFRFTHARTHARTPETRRLTLPVDTFIGRVLQHVLPRGLTKVRYDGLLRPTGRTDLERARHLLPLHAAQHARSTTAASETTARRASPPHDTGPTHVAAPVGHVDTASADVALTSR
jgi:YD repeat-containing protein